MSEAWLDVVTPDDVDDAIDKRRTLERAIARLNEREAHVVRARFWLDMSYGEIGRTMRNTRRNRRRSRISGYRAQQIGQQALWRIMHYFDDCERS